jgi:hypothetical protein
MLTGDQKKKEEVRVQTAKYCSKMFPKSNHRQFANIITVGEKSVSLIKK